MLELKHFAVGYGENTLLQIGQLAFEKGQISTILGSNGKGKTTLLRAMAGLLPYRGSVCADGQEISALSHRVRAHVIAYLPQTLTAPDMDVYTLVSHGRFSRLGRSKTLGENDRTAIRAAMEQTGVWELRERTCKTLSGGQKQCAYLAMAMAQDTPYLLLDEPDTFLDTAHRLHVQQILRTLADSGKGIVTVSHDIAAAFSDSDCLCLLGNKGGVVYATPQSLLENHALPTLLGVGVVPVQDERLLYPYALSKETFYADLSSAEPQQS